MKSRESVPKTHFSVLIYNPNYSSLWNAVIRWCSCFLGENEAMSRSSMYAKTKSSPFITSLMSRWNVWAALRSPNGIRVNSNHPNGVMTAVLGVFFSATGIW